MELAEFQNARLSRDPRFDGVFFVAVKTTGIFCRPVCPASPAKEQNVEYFETASEALVSGYRPCLRCRPESSPFSPAWHGAETTLKRALKIIHEEGFAHSSLTQLAERLGITDRYLRKLFEAHIGVAPKLYVQHQQILFAKSLLHQTHLSVADIAFAVGFNNVRRFNDAFKRLTDKTPSEIRKRQLSNQPIRIQLHYQAPYNWHAWHKFIEKRQMTEVEHLGSSSYGRSFTFVMSETDMATGYFNAVHRPDKSAFNVTIEIDKSAALYPVVQQIRRVLDLDANIQVVSQSLRQAGLPDTVCEHVARIPSCWNAFEAGVKAILGQQVSVAQATRLTNELIQKLGKSVLIGQTEHKLFPTPEDVSQSSLAFLKMPNSRRQTLMQFAQTYTGKPTYDEWQRISGIGPWTIDYAKLRSDADPDIWLSTDLGVKKALDIYPEINPDRARPWRSYLTMALWQLLEASE